VQAEAAPPTSATASRAARTERHKRKPDMALAPREGNQADRASLGADCSMRLILSTVVVFCDHPAAAPTGRVNP